MIPSASVSGGLIGEVSARNVWACAPAGSFSREATKRDCQIAATSVVLCEIDYQPAIVLPNVGLRVEL